MKESELLGTLFPSHPDFQPIIQKLRKKYNLREIDPDDDAITEINLGDDFIALEDFLLYAGARSADLRQRGDRQVSTSNSCGRGIGEKWRRGNLRSALWRAQETHAERGNLN